MFLGKYVNITMLHLRTTQRFLQHKVFDNILIKQKCHVRNVLVAIFCKNSFIFVDSQKEQSDSIRLNIAVSQYHVTIKFFGLW